MAGKRHANWVGTWAGGRIQEGPRGRVYWIEKQVRSHRYRIRLPGCGPLEAVDELAIWRANPEGYQPPHVRDALSALDEEESEIEAIEIEREATRLVMTDELRDAFTTAQLAGYATRSPVSEHHAFMCGSFLRDWATHPDIEGRDIRTVTLREWREALETGVSLHPVAGREPEARPWRSHRHRIVSLRSFTAWLRARGDLHRPEDTTLDFAVPQGRKPSPTERASKTYTIDELQRTYAAISLQQVRDLFWLRIHTGLHESEIARGARGEAVITRHPNESRIAAVIEVRHKNGHDHRQSIDAATLQRVERLMSRKRDGKPIWIGLKTLARAREAAAKASGCRPIFIGNLRHTRTTLLEQAGHEVFPDGLTGGIPLDRVARSHGHSPATADAFYSGVSVPPMLVVPVSLRHPDDP